MNRTPTPSVRLLLGTAVALALVVGLVGGLVVALALGGRSTDTGTVRAAYVGSDLVPATSCDDLLEWYVDRGVDLVGPDGWGSPYRAYASAAGGDDLATGSRPSGPAASAPGPATTRAVNEESGTNVQEAGVDEPDAVKTDGATLFRVADGDLTTYDVSGTDVERTGSLDLGRMEDPELLLAGGTLVVIGTRGSLEQAVERVDDRETVVLVVDVSDPTDPQVVRTLDYDTSLVTARLHGDVVRLVLQAGLPALDLVGGPPRRHDVAGATRANQDVVRESTVEDWLPTVSVDGASPERVLDCAQVALPDDEAGLGTVAVVGLDLSDPQTSGDPADRASVTGLAVDTDLAYASADRLYLAVSDPTTFGWSECFGCRTTGTDLDGASHLYSFALEGTRTVLAASGTVDGTIADRWSLDEADGVVRVAVGPSSRTDSANAVVTLGEEGDDLVQRGRVEGLGRGEQIMSMRWFDDLALMVTFRQTDPLYAIDLSDVDEPRLMGELRISGFSAYLHPLGEQRLIGLGEGPGGDGAWGAQLGLFDVTDLASPTRLSVLSYGPGTRARATTDPRQLTWLPDERTVLTVVSDHRDNETGYVSVVRLDDGSLVDRMVEVEHGSEIDAVRLVPLADGRVVLVTGDDASFFDLGT